jgi:AcrR family transcriptional regulator
MPKIIGGSLEEHRKQTREHIFRALATLMASQSFDTISFAQIASEAGVGRTALYNHFKDKEALVLAYAMDETERYAEALRAGMTGTSDPVADLVLYVQRHTELSRTFHVAQGSGLGASLSPRGLAQIRDHVGVINAVLRDILQRGVAVGAFAGDLDVEDTIPLINIVLVGRHIPEPGTPAHEAKVRAISTFVLRSVGAAAVPRPPGEHRAAEGAQVPA